MYGIVITMITNTSTAYCLQSCPKIINLMAQLNIYQKYIKIST